MLILTPQEDWFKVCVQVVSGTKVVEVTTEVQDPVIVLLKPGTVEVTTGVQDPVIVVLKPGTVAVTTDVVPLFWQEVA